jgi:hypothetical protein
MLSFSYMQDIVQDYKKIVSNMDVMIKNSGYKPSLIADSFWVGIICLLSFSPSTAAVIPIHCSKKVYFCTQINTKCCTIMIFKGHEINKM